MQFRTGTVCNPEMLNLNFYSDMVMKLAEAEAALVMNRPHGYLKLMEFSLTIL